MNVKETAVTNAADLALFKINLSHALLQPFGEQNPDYSILDLKSHHCGCRHASETIKMLPQKPDAILLADLYQKIAHRGAIPFTVTNCAFLRVKRLNSLAPYTRTGL